MEEKIIIKGTFGNTAKKCLIIGLLISVGLTAIYMLGFSILDSTIDNEAARNLSNFMLPLLCVTIPVGIILIVLYFYMSKMEITVTNTRVYGCSAFGKRVDLPNDSISAVGTSSFNGVDVATSAGTIKFKNVANNTELHKTISTIIAERQQNHSETITVAAQSNADELKKFKDLLDNGIITQEEFDAKKKQLLGL